MNIGTEDIGDSGQLMGLVKAWMMRKRERNYEQLFLEMKKEMNWQWTTFVFCFVEFECIFSVLLC